MLDHLVKCLTIWLELGRNGSAQHKASRTIIEQNYTLPHKATKGH